MLSPIEWKQIAGYPETAFCPIHDRAVEPIVLTDASGLSTWGCPYCAEETMPSIEAKLKVPEMTQRYLPAHYTPSQLTYWCPERKCNYRTNSKMAIEAHKTVMHSDTAKMKCSEGMCDKDAFDFCVQCESAMCKDHLDWKDMCPACSADGMLCWLSK